MTAFLQQVVFCHRVRITGGNNQVIYELYIHQLQGLLQVVSKADIGLAWGGYARWVIVCQDNGAGVVV